MTVRDLQSLALLLGLAMAGCSGTTTKDTGPTDSTPTGDDDDDDAVHDSAGGGGGGYFDVAFITWASQFGYDSATQSIVSVNLPGYGELPPTIDITLAKSEWQGAGFDPSATDLYCVVSLQLTDSSIPTWVSSNASLWYGVEYADYGGGTSCDNLDPYDWGDDVVATLGGAGTWGIGVGEASQDVQDTFFSQLSATDQAYWFGGVMQVPLLVDYQTDTIASIASEIDPTTYEVSQDGSGNTVDLDAASINLGNNIATGWYYAFDIYIYGLSR